MARLKLSAWVKAFFTASSMMEVACREGSKSKPALKMPASGPHGSFYVMRITGTRKSRIETRTE